MPVIKAKKVVAVCFLEATKLTLEHLSAHRLDLSNRGLTGPKDLPTIYGDTRRLRDFLQRSLGAYQDNVDLDLSDTDRDLLVACCRRNLEVIDLRLEGEQLVAADEKHWLQKKRQVMADWTVELAVKPLLELPLPRLSQAQTQAMRSLQARLNQKLFGTDGQRRIQPLAAPHVSPTAGLPSFAEQMPTSVEDAEPVAPRPSLAGLFADDEDEAAPAVRVTATTKVAAGAPPPLLESTKLRDPRLRMLVTLDLRSFGRALDCQDHRMAIVLLAALLESAVLDHAIARRAEIGLTGSPDSWNLQDVLVRVLGEACTPKDKSLAYQLFSSRNLLRPALQIVTPAVVTAASLERMLEFVRRVLHTLGFAGGDSVPERAEPSMLRQEGSSGMNVAPPAL
jgi:hypothetical protein